MKSMECYSYVEWMDADNSYCGLRGATEAAAEGEPLVFGYLQEVEEVNLDSLRAKDYLLIQTRNNIYRFTVLDPEERYGLLSGGSLGRHSIKAKLVATMPASQQEASKVMTIRQHSRAIFSVSSEEAPERLITSAIMKLTRVTGGVITETMARG